MSYTEEMTICDVGFTVVFSATPYVPAKISSPVENCYPEEGGEVNVEEIMIGDFEVSEIITPIVYKLIQEKCAELAIKLQSDEAEQAMKDQSEALYSRRLED